MLHHLDGDVLRMLALFLHSIATVRLLSTCRAIRHHLYTHELALAHALRFLRAMQSFQTKTWVLPIDWVTLLQMDEMTVPQLWRLSTRNMCDQCYKRYRDLLMFFLNAHHTDDACLRYLVEYIRDNPSAFLFSDWVGVMGNGDLMALTLAPASQSCIRLNGLEIDVTIVNSKVGQLSGEKFYVRHISTHGNCTGIYQTRFRNINYVEMGSNEQNTVIILNLAFLYRQLKQRQQRHDSINSINSLAPLPSTNCILPACLTIKGAGWQCIHLFALRAMELDDVTNMMLALEAYGDSRFGDLGLDDDDMWCLHFQPNSNSPSPPFYVGKHSSDSYPVHVLFSKEIKLTSYMMNLKQTSSLPAIALLVPLTLFLLYTHAICPKIYAWWMSVCPSYTHEEIASMRHMLRVNELPPINRVPLETPEGRSFVYLGPT